jgi:hypothetical protein
MIPRSAWNKVLANMTVAIWNWFGSPLSVRLPLRNVPARRSVACQFKLRASSRQRPADRSGRRFGLRLAPEAAGGFRKSLTALEIWRSPSPLADYSSSSEYSSPPARTERFGRGCHADRCRAWRRLLGADCRGTRFVMPCWGVSSGAGLVSCSSCSPTPTRRRCAGRGGGARPGGPGRWAR